MLPGTARDPDSTERARAERVHVMHKKSLFTPISQSPPGGGSTLSQASARTSRRATHQEAVQTPVGERRSESCEQLSESRLFSITSYGMSAYWTKARGRFWRIAYSTCQLSCACKPKSSFVRRATGGGRHAPSVSANCEILRAQSAPSRELGEINTVED